MSLYKRFGYSQTLADEGAWVPIGEGVEFKLRRMTSPLVQSKRRELEQPFEALQRSGGEIPEDQMKMIFRKLLSSAIILDWKNVEDRNGAMMSFSPAKAEELLTDLPDLISLLISLSVERANFRDAANETAAGNSKQL